MRRLVVASSIAAALFLSAAGVASADQDNGEGDDAFLCPVVSSAVLNAAVADTFPLPSGDASFRPGNNQAGTHANANALNENGGPSATNIPGADGFTPIWDLTPNP